MAETIPATVASPAPRPVRYRHGGDNRVLCQALFEQWRAQCYVCGYPARFVDIEIDHILPRTLTPEQLTQLIEAHDLPADFDVDSPANLAPICGACNRRKSDRRLTGTAVTVVLQQAREKQDRVTSHVASFLAGNKGWSSTVAVDQLLTSAEAAATRIQQITERAQSFDDAWRLDVHTGPDGVTLRYTPKSDTDAEQAGLPPLFDLSADDDGAREVARQLADAQDFGGEVCVAARYLRPSAGAAEPSYAELLGVTGPDDRVSILVGLAEPDPSTTVQLALVSAAAVVRQCLTLQIDRMMVGRRGYRLWLHDAARLFAVFVQIERAAAGGTITSQLTSTGFPGRYPYQLREVRSFVQFAEPTDQLEIRLNDQSLGAPVDVEPRDLAMMLMSLRYDTAVISALDRVQVHTGQRFRIPEQISLAERSDLLLAARLLDGEQIRLSDNAFTVTLEPSAVTAFLQAGQDGNVGELETIGPKYVIHCGPHDMLLGRVRLYAAQTRLTNLDDVRAAHGLGTTVPARYDHPGGDGVLIRLVKPDELPAEGALP
jgi:5-methylcytosine-specific restriction endonuclease McrA